MKPPPVPPTAEAKVNPRTLLDAAGELGEAARWLAVAASDSHSGRGTPAWVRNYLRNALTRLARARRLVDEELERVSPIRRKRIKRSVRRRLGR